jgi:hypothetical protein
MKKNNNRGSAFILVIVALALITIFTSTIFMQINHQIKNNYDLLINVNTKYAAEAGIENTISKLIEQIESKVNTYLQSSDKLSSVFSESDIYLELPSYTYSFGENYGYTVESIEKIPIEILYSNTKVQSIEDILLEIISIGTNRGKIYKIKSEVIFKTKKLSNGSFQTSYDIKTYDKM